MKIAVPVDENRSQQICPSFGRAPYFLIHDTETGSDEYRANPAAEAQGGAGIKAAQFVADSGAEVLITPRCGENAAKVFGAAGISVYRAQGSGAGDNIAALARGGLELLTSFHAGFHGAR